MNENTEIFKNKLFYNTICVLGLILLVFTGIYFGYTYKENEQYFQSREISYVKYINTKFLYNIEYTNNKDYANNLSNRIFNITFILVIIGILLVEYGYRNTHKYNYNESLKERIKNWYKRVKEHDNT